mmetsp:Transcript_72596/g.183112  ORF Transcript_72596/g.183112 Transcript_72596/m.183112 type:complete len:299 (-) Transcript_72596:10-906(-)
MSRFLLPALCWLSSSFVSALALIRVQSYHVDTSHSSSTPQVAVGGLLLRQQRHTSDHAVASSPEDEVFKRKPFVFPLDIGERRFVAAAEMTISLPWPYPLLRAYNVALYVGVNSALWGRSNGINEMVTEMPGEATLVYNLTSAFLDNQRFAASVPPMEVFMPNISWASGTLASLQSRYQNGPKFHEGSVIVVRLGKDGVHVWMDGVDAGHVKSPGPELSQAIVESTFQIPQFHDACYWNLLAGQPTEVAAPVQAEVHVTVPWYAVVFPTLAVLICLWCCWNRCISCLGACCQGKSRRC